MLIARRKFLRAGLFFGASAIILNGNARLGFARSFSNDGPSSSELLNDPIYRFTRETFEPYVGGYFEAAGARGELVALKLVKVDSYNPDPNTKISTGKSAATESFSLLFSAASALPPFPSIRQIKHGALGDFSVFLTQQDSKTGEIFYEAVFNHTR